MKIMRATVLLASALLLQGCFDDLTDIQQFMESVKANTPSSIPPLPKPKPFVHISYQSANSRSPFSAPKPEAVQDTVSAAQGCLSPDPARQKEPLEKYALDNLKMRGTLGGGVDVWALIEAADSSLHRVSKNNYLGLFHGRVVAVATNQIELVELIPDGAGCWKERTTVMQMAEPASSERQ